MKTPKKTYAQLEREVLELRAQSISRLKDADRLMLKAGDALMASACIVTITALGGREIVPAFAIYDGLSDASIVAIRADIQKTIKRVTA